MSGSAFFDQSRISSSLPPTEAKRSTSDLSLYAPLALAAFSFLFTVLQALLSLREKRPAENVVLAPSGEGGSIWQRVRGSHGGTTILIFKLVRLLALSALTLLSALQVLTNGINTERKEFIGLDAALTIVYLYASILAFLSFISAKWRASLIRQSTLVLLGVWGTLAFRDLWPLATYNLHTKDQLDTAFWVRFGLLFISGIFVPLFVPREYVPVDPKNPQVIKNPEQTASVASLVVYTFIDSLIFRASKVDHLSVDELPVLPDYEQTENMRQRAFRHLDPFQEASKKRHIFFNLLRVFSVEYSLMAVCLSIQGVTKLVAPFAINSLLRYFETEGRGATISPWVWVALLFVGPMLGSLSYQFFYYFSSKTLVRMEALFTQLIFEHSLRLRFKADESSTSVPPAEETTSDSVSEDQTVAQSETSSIKGKDSSDSDKDKSDGKNLVGRLNTLITVDLDNVGSARDFLILVLQLPVQTGLALAFLYRILGWSTFVGVASMVALMPVPGYLTALWADVERKKLQKTDARVQAVSEAVATLRMIKIFGWEAKIGKELEEKRSEELVYVWKNEVIQTFLNTVNNIIPETTVIITFIFYTVVMKETLTASKVFSSMAAFDILRDLMHYLSWQTSSIISGKVSLDRIDDFIKNTELLDQFDKSSPAVAPERDIIGFNDAVFSWANEQEKEASAATSSKRKFRLRVDGTVLLKRNAINLVIGPTGSGKTSVLMALLGEMHFIAPSIGSWFSLPRSGGVAYAAQESWVQNDTIRNNILFGAPYDEERYKKVISQCALQRDLDLFEAGDATEVGEKGLTLSGGQKARVTLARAIYSSAEILLLDDILAALDVHTSKWIVDKCLQGDLVRGRTIVLVTHHLALTRQIAEFIISVGRDGRVTALGKDTSLLAERDRKFAEELERQAERDQQEEARISDAINEEAQKDPTAASSGKLVLAEEVAKGRVDAKAWKLYLLNMSNNPIRFLSIYVLIALLYRAAQSFSLWFLGQWGAHGDGTPTSWWLERYGLIVSAIAIVDTILYLYYFTGTIHASRVINLKLVDSILRSTWRWLDETPTGRILTRMTKDIGSIDSSLSVAFAGLVEVISTLIVRLVGPLIFTPLLIFPALFVLAAGLLLGRIYMKAQLSVKREQSVAKAPVVGHFVAVVAGMVSVRAYAAQDAMKNESMRRINHSSRLSHTTYALNRWIAIRTDFLGAIFTSGLAGYLLVKNNLSAADVGFSLTTCLEFCVMILYVVRIYNQFELRANSLERIQEYIDIEHEPISVKERAPPAAWPKSGQLSVEKLSARYSKDGPKVLHDISFEVKPGERIGIVGRTGSGKSSLTLALLRCILLEGTVRYDGIDTSTINLDALRSSITVIPQMPELLAGTLRRNLDPFAEHDDSTLNSALRAAGLFDLQDVSDDARLTLDSSIASAGGNLSVGQRQILALARAIVRNSKLLILDEATSAIDNKTDGIIQASLRNDLPSDVTVLTVAHRLHTIMDADKVMVLDAGRIVEFASPASLLQKEGGSFKAMVDRSGDKEALYAMVRG